MNFQISTRVRGFTLIEVLVTLALMALIAAILIGSLQIGGHSWQRMLQTTAATEDVAQAQEFLRARLTGLYPQGATDSGMAHRPFLRAERNSLDFYSASSESFSNGLSHYEVSIASDTGDLVVRSYSETQNTLDRPPAETLLAHVNSLTVQFYSVSQGQPGHWVDVWEDPVKIPRLIRIDVAFAPQDHRNWPTLYIEPRIDTPVSCVFDLVSRRCRIES